VGDGDGELLNENIRFFGTRSNVNCPSFKYLNISSTISTNHSDYKKF